MSGPIVRSGPSEQFSDNWAKAFGEKPKKKKVAKASQKRKVAKRKKK